MSARYADLMKQGFMRPLPAPKEPKRPTDAEWAKGLVAAAKRRYASYGPDFFRD